MYKASTNTRTVGTVVLAQQVPLWCKPPRDSILTAANLMSMFSSDGVSDSRQMNASTGGWGNPPITHKGRAQQTLTTLSCFLSVRLPSIIIHFLNHSNNKFCPWLARLRSYNTADPIRKSSSTTTCIYLPDNLSSHFLQCFREDCSPWNHRNS